MSVFNGTPYLPQAIDSVLGQTFREFELIIVNDASTDATSKILRSYQDSRIMMMENERNLGLATSLNHALGVARGEYIARQDADDISYPDRFASQVALLDAHPQVGVVGATVEWIDEQGNPTQIWRKCYTNAEIQENLLRFCCLVHGSTMYRSQAIRDMGGYDEKMRTGQDYDLWLRMSEGWDIVCLPEVLYQYRKHAEMASIKQHNQQSENAKTSLQRAIERRLSNARLALPGGQASAPARLQEMDRRQLSQRYLWWSAGLREYGRVTAAKFLLASLAFDPFWLPPWKFLAGVLRRNYERLRNQ